jgi:hypothetical protein
MMKARLEWLGRYWKRQPTLTHISPELKARFRGFKAFFESPGAPSTAATEVIIVDCSDSDVIKELAEMEGTPTILAWIPDTLSMDDPVERSILEALIYGCLRELELLCISRKSGWDIVILDLPGRAADRKEMEHVAQWIAETRVLWRPAKSEEDDWKPCCRAVGYKNLPDNGDCNISADLMIDRNNELSAGTLQDIASEARMDGVTIRPQVFLKAETRFAVSQALHLQNFALMRQLWDGFSIVIDPPLPRWPEPGAPDVDARKRLLFDLDTRKRIEATDFFSYIEAKNTQRVPQIDVKQPEHVLRWIGINKNEE